MPRIRWEAIASPDYIASYEARVMGEVEISDLSNPLPEIQAAAEAECVHRRMMAPRNIHIVALHNRRADYEAVFPPDPLQAEWENMCDGKPTFSWFRDDDERLEADSLRRYQENKKLPWWRKILNRV